MKGLRRFQLRLGLAVGSTVFALLLGEAFARCAGFGAVPPVVRSGSIAFEPVPDGALRYVNRPECRFETVYSYGDRRAALVVRGTTNRQGFRGAELGRERGPARRIACLGDSYTFGEGVGDDETWPAQLQTELVRAQPGGAFEVLNAGVNAYDTRQAVRLLELEVLEFAPDVVLLAFFLNDAASRAEGAWAGFEYGKPSALHRALTVQQPARTLRAWSRLADGLADRIVRREYLVFLGDSCSRLYAQDSPGWQAARAELVRARDLCAARGIAFAVVLYPLLLRRGDALASHAAYEVVVAHCREQGIAVLDLEPVFGDCDVDALRVHPADSHPNGQAHRLAAGAIARFLAQEGLLDRH